jgi:hypothetical protein
VNTHPTGEIPAAPAAAVFASPEKASCDFLTIVCGEYFHAERDCRKRSPLVERSQAALPLACEMCNEAGIRQTPSSGV